MKKKMCRNGCIVWCKKSLLLSVCSWRWITWEVHSLPLFICRKCYTCRVDLKTNQSKIKKKNINCYYSVKTISHGANFCNIFIEESSSYKEIQSKLERYSLMKWLQNYEFLRQVALEAGQMLLRGTLCQVI